MFSECLCKIMDLPFDIACQESGTKLRDTFIFLNGNIVYVHEIGEGGITFTLPSAVTLTYTDKDVVDSLEVWVPETGIYFKKNSGSAVFLQRRPLRQWRKSFSSSFYAMTYMGKERFSILEIDPSSRKSIWVDENRVIRHFVKEIGYVKDSTSVVCTVKHFEQELLDWIKKE